MGETVEADVIGQANVESGLLGVPDGLRLDAL